MDHSVVGNDIGFGYLGVIDSNSHRRRNSYLGALNGFNFPGLDICCHYFACYDMISQNRSQLGLVFEQRVQISFRDFCEGLVGWRKNSERPFPPHAARAACSQCAPSPMEKQQPLALSEPRSSCAAVL